MTRYDYDAQVPQLMRKRSHGPCVGILQHFLIETVDAMLKINDEYDDETEKWVKVLQSQMNMGTESLGDFDWPTRRRVKAIYGFDFDAECLKATSQTTFMQPDGKHGLNWPPRPEEWR